MTFCFSRGLVSLGKYWDRISQTYLKNYLWGKSRVSPLRIQIEFFLFKQLHSLPMLLLSVIWNSHYILDSGLPFRNLNMYSTSTDQCFYLKILEHYIKLFIKIIHKNCPLAHVCKKSGHIKLNKRSYASKILSLFCFCYLFPFCFSWGPLVESCTFIEENSFLLFYVI